MCYSTKRSVYCPLRFKSVLEWGLLRLLVILNTLVGLPTWYCQPAVTDLSYAWWASWRSVSVPCYWNIININSKEFSFDNTVYGIVAKNLIVYLSFFKIYHFRPDPRCWKLELVVTPELTEWTSWWERWTVNSRPDIYVIRDDLFLNNLSLGSRTSHIYILQTGNVSINQLWRNKQDARKDGKEYYEGFGKRSKRSEYCWVSVKLKNLENSAGCFWSLLFRVAVEVFFRILLKRWMQKACLWKAQIELLNLILLFIISCFRIIKDGKNNFVCNSILFQSLTLNMMKYFCDYAL